jgi:hypothetical protein
MKRTRTTNRNDRKLTQLDTATLARVGGGFGGQELGDALTSPTPTAGFGGEDVGPDAEERPRTW